MVLIENVNFVGIVKFLNREFNKKQNGTNFTSSDVQQYIQNGKLPKYLGDIDIVRNEDIPHVKLYNIVKND